jgi:heme/copper-type cytochrome/quinol oxidase subunit 2
MIVEQYMFGPHCVPVPAGVPVHLRITSADVVHSLAFTGIDYGVKVAPGVVSQLRCNSLNRQNIQRLAMNSGVPAHFAMRSRLHVIPKEQFPVLSPDERRNCASR